MNLKKIRSLFSENDILDKLLELSNCLAFPDQDFINIAFKDSIKALDIKYNYMINLTERVKTYPKVKNYKICHYILCNPWCEEFPYKTDYSYFRYLLKAKQYNKVVYLLYRHRRYRFWLKCKQLKEKLF